MAGDGLLGEPLESGDVIYERDIRHLVEPEHNGLYAAIDLRTGEYEIAERREDAMRHLLSNRAWDTIAWVERVGFPTKTPRRSAPGEYRESPPKIIPKEVAKLGISIYERDIRRLVEPEHNGKFAAIDIHSGDHEIAECDWKAARKLLKRRPDAETALVKIGAPGTIPWPTVFLAKDDWRKKARPNRPSPPAPHLATLSYPSSKTEWLRGAPPAWKLKPDSQA